MLPLSMEVKKSLETAGFLTTIMKAQLVKCLINMRNWN